ncbi:translation machinery-associated protein [Zymoseptoria brevis]|uniref:Translation machinery-associated protein n=1 Tax=Zymoseptoria brevis TaxID=1047168 RepID=A0A0F4GMU2_9PEZI|nr:translation machinery-associated protein [Zymoseptoria brevis]
MPSKLSKVQKAVGKKKGGAKVNKLHENSRDAQRLRKAGARDEKVSRVASHRKKENRLWLDRLEFLKDNLPDTLHPLDLDSVKGLISRYLNRYDEELAQLRAERRAGRPPSTRQTLLEQQLVIESQEYEGGFWMPNLQDAESLVKLDAWDGRWLGLGNLRFVRVPKEGTVKESSFPPRGSV